MFAASTRRRGCYIGTLVWRFLSTAAPLAATQGAIAVMYAFDAWIIRDLGQSATAALTPASLLFLVPVFFGQGALSTVNVHTARDIGAGKQGLVGQHGWSGIYFGLAAGVLSLVLIPIAPAIFALYGGSPEVKRLEMEYFSAAIFAVPALHVSAAISNFLIGTNRPWTAFIATLVAILANAFFSYILVHGTFGLPALGLRGAAWGTVIATALQAALLFAVFINRKNRTQFGTNAPSRGLKNDSEFLRDSLTYGVQESVEVLTWSIIMSWLIGLYGDAHLAAGTCIIRIIQLSFMPSIGAGIALQTMVSDAIGRRRYDRAEVVTKIGAVFIIGYMSSFAILAYLFKEPFITLFAPDGDQEVIEIAVSLMLIVVFFQFFDSIGIVFGDALKGAGDVVWPSVVNFVLSLLLLVGGGLAVRYALPALESRGVWLVDLCYVASLGILFFFRWNRKGWRTIELSAHQEVDDSRTSAA